MKKLLLISFLFVAAVSAAQEIPEAEQQIENLAEVDDAETEDDSYLQALQYYRKNKLNLNTVTEAELKEFPFLSPLHIADFLNYRKLFGRFISVYELQAVPLWEKEIIQKILPYVLVGTAITLQQDFKQRFSGGEHSVLTRLTYVLEKAEGFRRKSDTAATSFYPGGREKVLLRYRYNYRNILQYGFTAEKDPGEQWFKGAQKYGFDYYSAHLFVRNMGMVKNLALGDYTVNLGQGLIQWQSLAFRKSVAITNIKRQAPVLRPFNSASEYFFNRGAGITLEKNHFQITTFASFRKVSGNIFADTANAEDYFSSLITSGLHRTDNEQADKNAVQMNSSGGNISYNKNNLHIGANTVHFEFNPPYNKEAQPYNNFAFRGKQLTNSSIDWAYTLHNLHWFGEIATHNGRHHAILSGLLMAVDSKIDLSFVYRNIQPGYQSIFGNAFTEATYPTNEKGLFAGAAIKPSSKWELDAYVDIYRFPYLRYRVDAPSNGADYLVQLTYRPGKQIEIYTRYRQESKAMNFTADGELNTANVSAIPRKNWRTQVQFKINPSVTLRYRLDAMWYDLKGPLESRGFLSFFDLFYKPLAKPFAANLRLQYFETDNYDSRIYAYENDVLYGFSIPAFYDKGTRYYINLNYDISKRLSFWVKWGQLIYQNPNSIGSGLDELPGNHRSELKCQLLIRM